MEAGLPVYLQIKRIAISKMLGKIFYKKCWQWKDGEKNKAFWNIRKNWWI